MHMFSSLSLLQLCNNLQFCLDAYWKLLRHNLRLNSRRQRVLLYKDDRANTSVLDAHLRSHFLRIMMRFLSRNKINTSGWISIVVAEKDVQWKRERIENECCSCSSIFFLSVRYVIKLSQWIWLSVFSVHRSRR